MATRTPSVFRFQLVFWIADRVTYCTAGVTGGGLQLLSNRAVAHALDSASRRHGNTDYDDSSNIDGVEGSAIGRVRVSVREGEEDRERAEMWNAAVNSLIKAMYAQAATLEDVQYIRRRINAR